MQLMLILYDFRCSQGHLEDKLVPSHTKTDKCSVCQGTSKRVISPVRSKLDGTDPGFPDAYDKWARDHEKAGGVSPE